MLSSNECVFCIYDAGTVNQMYPGTRGLTQLFSLPVHEPPLQKEVKESVEHFFS
jgi:hypothetical protein